MASLRGVGSACLDMFPLTLEGDLFQLHSLRKRTASRNPFNP